MDRLPEALKALADFEQFILWKLAAKDGKPTKLPVNYRTGAVANAQDSNLWASADQCIEAHKHFGTNFGVGFVFTESDPFFFLDVDNCYDHATGGWSDMALNLCNRLPGAAVEVSQSGRGLHIIGAYSGAEPVHSCKNVQHGIELYTSGRFVALTGAHASGNAATNLTSQLTRLAGEFFPAKISTDDQTTDPARTSIPAPEWNGPTDDEELIAKMLSSRPGGRTAFGGGATIKQLWEGDTEVLAATYPSQNGHSPYDASSADAALCMHLAFWTGKDCARMDRLFRRSALLRGKWIDRPDYRERTILNAISVCTEVYGNRPKPILAQASSPRAVSMRSGPQLMAAKQQVKYFAGCVYMRDRNRVFTPDGGQLKPEQFNATYGGYEFLLNENKTTRKAWEAFTESQCIDYPWAHAACFRPELASGVIIEEGNWQLVNLYVAAPGERRHGNISPFLAHIERLLPNEADREIFLSYLAACVQQPGVKFQWCVVLQGAEGNGKTVFYYVLAYALGERYAHLPNAAEITNPFNAWIEQKLIIGIEELHTAGRQEVADALKQMITNKRIEIHGKGQDQRTGDNRANFIMFSNHKDAVLKTENDRRYCVFYSAQQERADLIRHNMDSKYFARLYDWLESGGYAHVAQYLSTRAVTVDMLGRAPRTSSTAEAVRSSLGVAEQLVAEAIDLEESGFRGDFLCTKSVSELLRQSGKKLSPQKIASVLTNLGYVKHPALLASEGKATINGVRLRLYVRRGSLAAKLKTADVVVEAWNRAHIGHSPSSTPVRTQCALSDSLRAP